MSPVICRLTTLFSKLTSNGKSKHTILSQEDEDLLSTLFSQRVLKMFEHSHLFLTFASVLSPPPSTSTTTTTTGSGPEGHEFLKNDDKVIELARKNVKEYEKMNGRVHDAGKLERCLTVEVGLKGVVVSGYIKWKRDSALGGMGFDGAEWNEEWVGEVGGVEGALAEILENL
ncbi:hypothetical protein TWF730_006304 [Orbilia blumenaviensis]|uniref:Uncharacterized protein n=1 Tax=Orbilia blumenaviensis TaxID=1796055 RepID=A0AAV9VDT9_9PEZI